MKSWENILIRPNNTIRDALLNIDANGMQIVLVVDESRKLLGTLSDGDIRRGLLKGLSLSDTVEKVMFINPRFARKGESMESILSLMRKLKLQQLPIVDDSNRVVGMEFLSEYLLPSARENWVILMAGGLGTRMGDLTRTTPKPMLNVGDRPLLETILKNFLEQGFQNFYISVHYKAEVIESHFGEGERFGARIRYLREDKRLGTAGALSLLPELPSEPVIVANGDLLANIDYLQMLSMHVDNDSAATMGVSEYEFQIPYGVVREVDGRVQSIDEKPIHRSLVSAGVYVLSPETLSLVPKDTFFDMPNLFDLMISRKMKAGTYKVRDYWLDIGRQPDYQKANSDIGNLFREPENRVRPREINN